MRKLRVTVALKNRLARRKKYRRNAASGSRFPPIDLEPTIRAVKDILHVCEKKKKFFRATDKRDENEGFRDTAHTHLALK